MKMFKLLGADNLELQGMKWDGVEAPLGVVQISHGMAEHISRYEEFAEFLNANGFIVYGHDHRGHGDSVTAEEDYGFLSDEEGWSKLVSDLHLMTLNIKGDYPSLPIYIFGHSMGSFALRDYLTQFGSSIDGAIICGTGNNPNWLNQIALWFAKRECKNKGPRHHSKFMTKLSFGSYNNKFKPNKTEFDWLSRDEIQVYKYIEDSECGRVFTSQFYVDFLTGIIELSKQENVNKIPKDKPYLFISGEDDPLCRKGEAIQFISGQFKQAGISNVQVKIYSGARHELTNETNRQEIYSDVLLWLNENINKLY